MIFFLNITRGEQQNIWIKLLGKHDVWFFRRTRPSYGKLKSLKHA